MEEIEVEILLEEMATTPVYGSEEAAGADFTAAIEAPITLKPGERKLIPTGTRLKIPKGYEMQVRPRSGLALKHGISVVNSPGTIDSDYRGLIGIILINLGSEDFTITPNMRIAQGVFAPVIRANFVKKDLLESTVRGEGGFGHTGTH